MLLYKSLVVHRSWKFEISLSNTYCVQYYPHTESVDSHDDAETQTA